MTSAELAAPHVSYSSSTTDNSELEIELCSGLGAAAIDGQLMRATRARNVTYRLLAYYLDELDCCQKFRDLGYSCIASYANQRLGIDPRRARELCQAGRALMKLELIDRAFLDGVLCWTKTELLTHGVREHEQDEWIGRAQKLGCSELKQLLIRHRKGLSTGCEKAGGLPRSEFELQGTFSAAAYAKFEQVREDLMRRRGVLVDDSEVLNYILEKHEVRERDAEREAELAVECEQKETPDWLRQKVMTRDGYRCKACGGSDRLHAHHIVFRSRGGLTREDNLVTVCCSCHGLIHEGRLFASVSPEGVEFHNRFGEAVMASRRADASLPGTVLRVLRSTDSESGGHPPVPEVLDLDHSNIPDSEMSEWFKKRMHLYEIDRSGAWVVKKSEKWRVTFRSRAISPGRKN